MPRFMHMQALRLTAILLAFGPVTHVVGTECAADGGEPLGGESLELCIAERAPAAPERRQCKRARAGHSRHADPRRTIHPTRVLVGTTEHALHWAASVCGLPHFLRS